MSGQDSIEDDIIQAVAMGVGWREGKGGQRNEGGGAQDRVSIVAEQSKREEMVQLERRRGGKREEGEGK